MDELKKARKDIDIIDTQMRSLFLKRMEAVKKIGEVKLKSGMPVFDKKREEALFKRLVSDDIPSEFKGYYEDYLKNYISISKDFQRSMQSGLSLAVAGEAGAFADVTAKKVFPDAVNVMFNDFEDAYNSVKTGKCDFAFLPLENSYNGEVGKVLDLAFSGDLFITGIFSADIYQNLLGLKGSSIKDIKTVISHPQALSQCEEFIKENGFMTKSETTTSLAAKKVAALSDKSIGAIASIEAANENGLNVLKTNINKSKDNVTRFAVFSRTAPKENANAKRFLIMFTVKDAVGELLKAVSVIAKHNFNMISLKSRPTKSQNWDYYFFVEGEGNIYSKDGKEMLAELKNSCVDLKLLGSF